VTKPRPLTPDERRRTIADLRALADELDRPDAARTQRNLAAALDDSYGTTASGAGAGGGSGGSAVLTAVEAKAAHSDPTAAATARLLVRLHQIRMDAGVAYSELTGWRPDRPVATCAEGHTLDRSSSRCTYVDPETGRRCGTRKETILTCENPTCQNDEGTGPVVIQPGDQRWRKPALDLGGKVIAECSRCRSYRRRNQRSWAPATRLEVPGVGVDGVFSTDNEPWPNVG